MRLVLTIGFLLATSVQANPFLDIYLHIYPSDDFCGASQCNITYALSLLVSQNQFDLQSVKLQEGLMTRNLRYTFEDNTVLRLNKGMFHTLDKIYLGLSLFDVPEDMQDYIVVDVTNVINNKGKRARIEFITETMRVKIHVYRRNEVAETDNEDVNAVELDTEHSEHSLNALSTNANSLEHGCNCENGHCTCCRHLSIRKVRLNDIICINMTYVPEKHGFQTALAVQGQTPHYGKEVMTEHKHQPTCFEMLREYATVCPRLYNFEQTTNEISACVEIEARLYHVKVARKKIGCLRVPI